MKQFYLLLLCASLSLAASSETIFYVSTTGNDANNGTSWSTAFKTLTKALNAASSGDNIYVAAGLYKPTINPSDRSASFIIPSGVIVSGGFTAGTNNRLPGTSILSGDIDNNDTNTDGNDIAESANHIKGSNSYHVVVFNFVSDQTRLDGFTITAGSATSTDKGSLDFEGGGILNNGISNGNGSKPYIINCRLSGNQANIGGGMYNDGELGNSSPTLVNCVFMGNQAVGFDPYAPSGGAMNNTGRLGTCMVKLVNCSFSNNVTGSRGGVCYNYGDQGICQVTMTNCVEWNNGGSNAFHSREGATLTVNSSVVEPEAEGYSGSGNIFVDPLWNPDLTLTACSPAVNAGMNSANTTTTDLNGNARIFNTTVDMGAYESQIVCCPSGNVLYVNKNASGNNNGSSWANAFTNLQDAIAKTSQCANVAQIWVSQGTYYPDEGAGHINDNRSESFLLKNGVAIYGGFAGTETLLNQRNWQTNVTILSGDLMKNDGANFANNGDNAFHVVQGNGTHNTAVLDGFTITAGNATGGGLDIFGGGMYNLSSSPTLTNCSFSGNTAFTGGGMYSTSSSPALTNCSFSENSASSSGGGMFYVFSSPTLTNCSFSGNTSANGGGMFSQSSSFALTNCSFSGNTASTGGGMHVSSSSSSTLTNCSFSGNTAINGGGMLNASSSPSLFNCIFWGDTGGEILNIVGPVGSHPSVSYSIIQGGCPVDGNCTGVLNTDPLFVNEATGNLRLQACSPAIDAGNDAANTTTTDLDGNPRKIDAISGGSKIDMGAYEFQEDLDADNDGYSSCNNQDCDDNNSTVHEKFWFYADKDGDGYGAGSPVLVCAVDAKTPPAGYSTRNTDCADGDNSIYPGAPELCDGKDNDCDNQVDEEVGPIWYKDVDGDGYGDPNNSAQSCNQPSGYVSNNQDCNDNNDDINPETTWWKDDDNDGYGNPNIMFTGCTPAAGGWVMNNYDCDDNKNNTKKPEDNEVLMCNNGKQECVKAKEVQKKQSQGWVLGPCAAPCKDDKVLMCHNGKLHCVKRKDVQNHLSHAWTLGYCGAPTPAASVTSIIPTGSTLNTQPGLAGDILPAKFTLAGYPNPFTKATRIAYTMPVNATVNIKVYDMLGREVSLIFSGERAAGLYSMEYNGAKISSGIYYVRMVAITKGQAVIQTQKLVKAD